MLIQIKRISAQSIHRSIYRCTEPHCSAIATWSLVDLGLDDSDVANLGERPCCVDHIAAAYLSLRGAHLVAQALSADQPSEDRSGVDRRRRRKRRTIAKLGGVLARGVG